MPVIRYLQNRFSAQYVDSITEPGPSLILAEQIKTALLQAQELKEAGALYEDLEVVVDGNLVTSRQPSDLPMFMKETMKKIRGLK